MIPGSLTNLAGTLAGSAMGSKLLIL